MLPRSLEKYCDVKFEIFHGYELSCSGLLDSETRSYGFISHKTIYIYIYDQPRGLVVRVSDY